jgi:hypothetical protein
MSDFGTMVIVGRRDRKSMDEYDQARLKKAIEVVKAGAMYQDATSEPFRFGLIQSQRIDGTQDSAVVLSEYWLEGIQEGSYQQTDEEMLEHDRGPAEAVRQALGAELGSTYDLELICGHW